MHGKHAGGFTLAELLTTLAVVGVCLGLGLPAFGSAMRQVASANAHHAVTASLASARLAAISRRAPVTVCPSSDGATCRRDLAWEGGWILFEDPVRSGVPAGPHAVLRRQDPLDGLTVRATIGRHYVRFLPSGLSSGSNASLWLCSTDDSRLLGRVIVSNAGRTRSEHATGAPGCPHAR